MRAFHDTSISLLEIDLHDNWEADPCSMAWEVCCGYFVAPNSTQEFGFCARMKPRSFQSADKVSDWKEIAKGTGCPFVTPVSQEAYRACRSDWLAEEDIVDIDVISVDLERRWAQRPPLMLGCKDIIGSKCSFLPTRSGTHTIVMHPKLRHHLDMYIKDKKISGKLHRVWAPAQPFKTKNMFIVHAMRVTCRITSLHGCVHKLITNL